MQSGTEKCRFLNDHFYLCFVYYVENQMKEVLSYVRSNNRRCSRK